MLGLSHHDVKPREELKQKYIMTEFMQSRNFKCVIADFEFSNITRSDEKHTVRTNINWA